MHISCGFAPAELSSRVFINCEIFVNYIFFDLSFPHVANIDINIYLTGLLFQLMRYIKKCFEI